MAVPDAIVGTATEYLRGQDDELSVLERQIDGALNDLSPSDRPELLDEVEDLLRGVAKDISPDNEDRLQVLLELVEKKRSDRS